MLTAESTAGSGQTVTTKLVAVAVVGVDGVDEGELGVDGDEQRQTGQKGEEKRTGREKGGKNEKNGGY